MIARRRSWADSTSSNTIARAAVGLPAPRVTPVRSSTEDEPIHEWAEALSLPANFGHNLDAFEECFTDTRRPPPAPAAGPGRADPGERGRGRPRRQAGSRADDPAPDPRHGRHRRGSVRAGAAPQRRPRHHGTTAVRGDPGHVSGPGRRARTAAARRGVPPAGGTPARGWVSPLRPPSAGRRSRRSRRASPAGRARRPR
ncbi:hypothetical protein CG736_25465 [Kitasatospora sp. CB02891]|nr:hypothetical protein CG736_25465 [Kitasatospora sp. CB02891]